MPGVRKKGGNFREQNGPGRILYRTEFLTANADGIGINAENVADTPVKRIARILSVGEVVGARGNVVNGQDGGVTS